MKVIDHIFSDGERRSLLVHEDMQIDFWSTLYVTAELTRSKTKLYKERFV